MYEQLPVPFGLVRFGIAPDHPEVKNCQDEFEQVASSPDFTFVGNMQLGQDIPLSLLANNYDAIVFAYGASKDRDLGLEDEHNSNASIYSARAFVAWYNGLPEYRDLDPNLESGDTAVIVGQGNVAMDVARILLQDVDTLSKTDITDYALRKLRNNKINHVHVVGRRGPMQAAFTIKEVRELIQLSGVNFTSIQSDLFPSDLKALPRPKRRIMELLQKGKPHDPNATKSITLDFLLAPKALNWSERNPDELTGLTFTRTQLDNVADPTSSITKTGKTATVKASSLFRSIGYRAEPLPGMEAIGATFDARAGTLRHDGYGRILPLTLSEDETATSAASVDTHVQPHAAGVAKAALYCAGWVKRGPTGVIASTMTDAFETAEAIVQDWKTALAEGKHMEEKRGWKAVREQAIELKYRVDKVVDWDGWRRIDGVEKESGKAAGKPREKFGRVEELVGAAIIGER